jgi:hypothetical protein
MQVVHPHLTMLSRRWRLLEKHEEISGELERKGLKNLDSSWMKPASSWSRISVVQAMFKLARQVDKS